MTSSYDTDDVSAWLRLLDTPGVGIHTALRLLRTFGLPQQIFAHSYSELTQCVSETIAQALLAPPSPLTQERIARTLDWLAQPDNHLINLADESYPPLLLEMADPPALLYVRGRLSALVQPAIALVGSRQATLQGTQDAQHFARTLATAGLIVISGLASGIDAAAHRGALTAIDGQTIAVVGTGIDRVYPATHLALAHEIAQQGAIVSEFPLGTPPARHHFPQRNRIIAGLSRGVVVIEAAAQSGSLITARLASEMGREVFALPGSIHSPLAKGCHALIKQGAKLTESAEDILQELRLPLTATASPISKNTASEPILGGLIGHKPVTLDEICTHTGLDITQANAQLLHLELAGEVELMANGRYRRLN
ncbi:MAG: DNA-protecting protein DprA [Ottowia sp.]|nr:DNA-protecting protein DprA [Ottowia sp.]